MRILYLDFDGVLHHERVYYEPERGFFIHAGPQFSLFQHAELLSDLLRPYPDVKIVLSTAWVRQLGAEGAVSQLPLELRTRVIGSTSDHCLNEDDFWQMPRGQQVSQDVLARTPTHFLAVDDSEDGWPPALKDCLVVADSVLGISEPQVLELLKQRLRLAFKDNHGRSVAANYQETPGG